MYALHRFSVLCIVFATLAARAAEPAPLALPEGEPYVHEPSGFRFPVAVGTFQRVSAYRYDEEGRNVSVTFNDQGLKIVMTAYVYPHTGATLDAHFKQVTADVTRAHPGARVRSAGEWKLKQGERGFARRLAEFRFVNEFAGKRQELTSRAYLLRAGEHFIKFRVTHPAAAGADAGERIDRFLAALVLPEDAAAAPDDAKAARPAPPPVPAR
jgi:hypothetical protein